MIGNQWDPGDPPEIDGPRKKQRTMSRTSIKDWLWSQHAPPEVMASFEKLFALPKKLQASADEYNDAMEQADNPTDRGYFHGRSAARGEDADELSAILEGKD